MHTMNTEMHALLQHQDRDRPDIGNDVSEGVFDQRYWNRDETISYSTRLT
jgi:hypothetical protein